MSSSHAWRTIAWGLFASASWTWCIGMFLPFIMLRDYGWAGFLTFAIPNVIGCAAFGYLVDRDCMRGLRERLGPWPARFTMATIIFQAAFAGWMLPPAIALACVVAGFLLSWCRSRSWLVLSVVIGTITLACLLSGNAGDAQGIAMTGARPLAEIGFLAPAIALGFVLCPYLDLTFHRTLAESPSRHCFGVFGIAFAATLTGIAWLFDPSTGAPRASSGLLVLWAAQLAFTIGAHGRERLSPLAGEDRGSPFSLGVAITVALFAGWLLRVGPGAGSLLGESCYLRYLGLYGLVFPFMLLFRVRGVRGAWPWIAVLVGIPCYEAAFVHHATGWIILPILLLGVLLWRHWDNDETKDTCLP